MLTILDAHVDFSVVAAGYVLILSFSICAILAISNAQNHLDVAVQLSFCLIIAVFLSTSKTIQFGVLFKIELDKSTIW